MKKAVLDTRESIPWPRDEEALVDRENEALQKNLADKKKCIIIGLATNLFLMAPMYLPVHKIVPRGFRLTSN